MDEMLKSKALEVNLQETSNVEIVIPEDHLWLQSLSADQFGLHQRISEFIRELNHPYHNVEYLAENLRKIAISDFWFYASHTEASRAFTVLLDIQGILLLEKESSGQTDSLLQTLSTFLQTVNSEEKPYPEILEQGVQLLEKLFEQHPLAILKNGNNLKKRLDQLVRNSPMSDRLFSLFKRIAQSGIEIWEAESSIVEWAHQNPRFFPEENGEIVEKVGDKFYKQLKQQLKGATTWEKYRDNVMLFSDIADYHRQIISEFLSPISQFYYIINLLRMSTMEHLKEYLIWDLNKLLAGILSEVPNRELHDFVDSVFELFQELQQEHNAIVLDSIATMGREFALYYSKGLVSQFEDHVIRIGYTPPGTALMTSDWQLKTDPNHLKSLRVWLDLIEVAPNRFEKLLPALIVHIKLGGVLIFDTDLFQRNISKLLNADIRRVYKPVKELCKLFPVYFNEIGAEGELRDVSTELDSLSLRHDKLMHFLRKQIHIDSNNLHLDLADKIMRYWVDQDFASLEPMLPPDIKESVKNDKKWSEPIRQLIAKATQEMGVGPYDLLHTQPQEVGQVIKGIEGFEEVHKEKLRLFIRLVGLLRNKYFADAIDVAQEMRMSGCVDRDMVEQFEEAERKGDHDTKLSVLYQCMENLNTIVTGKEKTESWETIYYKRHVAFGIPSMYGQYREPKFEALGTIFKMEKAASKCMYTVANEVNLSYITAKTLRQIAHVLSLFYQGLQIDGITSQTFESNLAILRHSLSSSSFSLNQYINIFEFLSDSVQEIIQNSFYRRFDGILKVIVPMYASGEDDNPISHLKTSEWFYREMLSSSFLLQDLDSFIAKVLSSLNDMADLYSSKGLRNIVDFDEDMMITELHQPKPTIDNKVFLGAKGYFLKNIFQAEFPVPPGFILTTELFRRRDTIMDYKPLFEDFKEGIKHYVGNLEKISRQKFGCKKNPLLLSVRSGAPLSMPGAMNTFLNVGMNDEITEALSKQPNMGWTAWDSYRRFLQTWGQAFGLDRALFDNIVARHQKAAGAEIKETFEPEQMKKIAMEYKSLLAKHKVPLYDDVYDQLFATINEVLDSWDGPRARLYRKHMQIADEWGTAVIIQKMVFGNLHRTSGTGVVFTFDASTENPGIRLNGDYSLLSQGEDVVSGITNVLPISDHQQKTKKGSKGKSLQIEMPRTYQRLFKLADRLVNQLHFGHQEIEFTFESDNPYDLYILQTREQQIYKPEVKVMYQTPPPRSKLLGRGISVGASVLNGYIVFNLDDLKQQKELHPDGKFIYVSGDTTPDDLPLIFECDGLITSRGGSTSHAAVTAGRLGKVGVVNCTDMVVFAQKKECAFGTITLIPGDAISLDAHTGSIYKDHYKLM